MKNKKIQEMLDSLGAMSEITFAQYRALEQAGFKADQALQLTGVFLSTMLKESMRGEHEGDA